MTRKGTIFFVTLCFSGIALSEPSRPTTWISAEDVYWWTQNSPVSVPLITQNNTPGTLGVINQPGTQIIFGKGSSQQNFNFGGINGGRVAVGHWFTNMFGMEASGFHLANAKSTYTASSVNSSIPVTNIPFFDTQTQSENVLVDKHPNIATVSDAMQPWGFEFTTLYDFSNKSSLPFIFIAGLQYINITEHLTLNDAIYELPSFPNSVVNVQDNFTTRNNFVGIELGARHQYQYQKFFFDMLAALSVGENFEELNVKGELNENNTRIIQPIGLFAEPSNIGSFHQNQFAVLPELKLKAGYHFNSSFNLFFTYNVFYITNIIRPGEQIDRNINKSQNPALGGSGVLTGTVAPLPQFNQSSFWMQGVSVGLQWNLA